MNTKSSNHKVVPQRVDTVDKGIVRYGSFVLPVAVVKRIDAKTQDFKKVRYGSFTIPQACRR